MNFYHFLFTLIISEVSFAASPSCTSQFITNGKCVPIDKCKNVFAVQNDPKYQRYITLSLCSQNQNTKAVRHVCCSPSEIIPEPSSPPRLNSNLIHANAKLLPKICGDASSDRISNGNDTSLFQYPWMALLFYKSPLNNKLMAKCAGTIINSKYILTAAHCLKNQQVIKVRLGEHDLSKSPDCAYVGGFHQCAVTQDLDVDKVVIHSSYDTKRQSDIGLIRLRSSLSFDRDEVQPICLPVIQNLRTLPKNLIVTGWGLNEDLTMPSILQQAIVPFVDSQTCMQKLQLSRNLIDGQLCAGGVANVDNCQGDSGGPLQFLAGKPRKMYQFGIVSYGQAYCGARSLPGVYTNVGHYIDWILDNVAP